MEKTIGEKRVRIDFNVDGNKDVDHLKRKSAELINTINILTPDPTLPSDQVQEFHRLKALAMTKIEEGCMWAVKAATI